MTHPFRKGDRIYIRATHVNHYGIEIMAKRRGEIVDTSRGFIGVQFDDDPYPKTHYVSPQYLAFQVRGVKA